MMWHSFKEKPTKDGIYVVAKFDGDRLVELCTQWCVLDGVLMPNTIPYFGSRDMTHWISQSEYYRVLENLSHC